jgi:hypothetical protein
MKLGFSRRALLLAILAVGFSLVVFRPVVHISPTTCARIVAGMTEHEAWQAVGVPPGWYDGVGGISTNSPASKGYKPDWIGFGGGIVVDLDDTGHVAKATFYPGKVLAWSFVGWLWERLARVQYCGISLPQRLDLFLAITALLVWILGVAMVRVTSANSVAEQGALGLVVGLAVAVFLFADLFLSNDTASFLLLIGPILGTTLAILVAICRQAVNRRVGSGNGPTEMAEIVKQ